MKDGETGAREQMMARLRYSRPSVIINILILVLLLSCGHSHSAGGDSPKQLYFKGEACYHELCGHPSWQKYRSRWKECIAKFERVHSINPHGPWAAAGLYMKGKLYAELYEHSYRPEDIRIAETIFSQIISDYPQSEYRDRAKKPLPGCRRSNPIPGGRPKRRILRRRPVTRPFAITQTGRNTDAIGKPVLTALPPFIGNTPKTPGRRRRCL
ncbi:MAG: hypothetical protein KGY61_00700 [Desulfobacterales bacterium]|nr:hypothetical protein [Desulfobacterales bacterium]